MTQARTPARRSPSSPKHMVVTEYLREQIQSHKLPPRHMLESEAELCERFGISRGPVRQALSALEQEGLIYRVSGRGSFVSDDASRLIATPRGAAPSNAGTASGAPSLWMMPVASGTGYMLESLMQGLEDGATRHGAVVMVGSLQRDQQVHPLIDQGRVAGVFACASDASPGVYSHAALADVPKVWLMTRREGWDQNWDAVSPDNIEIGRMAARYLMQQGHTCLALLNPVSSDPSAIDRLPGFVSTAHAAGATVNVIDDAALPQSPSQSRTRYFPSEFLSVLVDRLLTLNPRPTGLFVPGDMITAMIQPMLQERGIRVGQDMVLISCNNDEATLAALHPRPATIDMNCFEIGRRAADLMAARTMYGCQLPPITLMAPPVLIEP